MIKEDLVKKYLEKAKKLGLDMKKEDILFLSSLIQNIVDKEIIKYKKRIK